MIERGQIPTRRLGRRVVVLVTEFDAHLKALPSGALARRRASATSPPDRLCPLARAIGPDPVRDKPTTDDP
jgi:hypothetical protein